MKNRKKFIGIALSGIGVAMFLIAITLLGGCDFNTQTDSYVKDYYLTPEIVTPNEVFTLTYVIKNPDNSDREVFLEIDLSNNLNRVNAPYSRVSLGDIESKKTKSFFNKFKPTKTDKIQEITIKLYSTENSETPINIKKIPVEIASEAK